MPFLKKDRRDMDQLRATHRQDKMQEQMRMKRDDEHRVEELRPTQDYRLLSKNMLTSLMICLLSCCTW